jgi:hypothetical protein
MSLQGLSGMFDGVLGMFDEGLGIINVIQEK